MLQHRHAGPRCGSCLALAPRHWRGSWPSRIRPSLAKLATGLLASVSPPTSGANSGNLVQLRGHELRGRTACGSRHVNPAIRAKFPACSFGSCRAPQAISVSVGILSLHHVHEIESLLCSWHLALSSPHHSLTWPPCEAWTEAFKRFKLGKVVGVRTWGGVVEVHVYGWGSWRASTESRTEWTVKTQASRGKADAGVRPLEAVTACDPRRGPDALGPSESAPSCRASHLARHLFRCHAGYGWPEPCLLWMVSGEIPCSRPS